MRERRIAAGRWASPGQSLTELAITLPMLLALVLGCADLGRAFYYREQVANAARQAARVAVLASQQATGNTVCAAGGTATTTIPASSASSIQAIADTAALEDSASGTPSGSALAGATVTVTWHCVNGHAVTNSTNQGVTDPADPRSDAVEVKVSYRLAFVTPFISQLLGQSGTTITADVVGRAQY